MKLCRKCNLSKSYNEFCRDKSRKDGYRNICRQCSKQYYYDNKDRINKRKRQYHKEHSVAICADKKIYYKRNKDRILAWHKTYYDTNREKLLQYKAVYRHSDRVKSLAKTKYTTDKHFKLTKVLRSRLYQAIKNNQKQGSAISDLGCTIPTLVKWLEDQFLDGMTWANWGNTVDCWTIDHIVPAHYLDFNNRQHLLLFCNYRNLRPLWFADNIGRDYTDILDILDPNFINEFIPMFPDSMPIFTPDMILIDPDNYESDDGRKTTVGWLKELFLFQNKGTEHIWVDDQDRKIYKTVLDKFKKLSKIGVNADLHEWEETNTAKKQAACLNQLRRSLGYTEVMDV